MTLYFLDYGMGCSGKLDGIWLWDISNPSLMCLKQDNRTVVFVPLSFPGWGGAFGLEIFRWWSW